MAFSVFGIVESLRLEIREHRGSKCVMVLGRIGDAAYRVIKSFPGRLYSKTHGCWYIPYSAEGMALLKKRLEVPSVVVSPQDIQQLKQTKRGIVLPEGYHDQLIRVRYSPATVGTYESQMRKFLEWLQPRGIEALNDEVINKYQLYLAADRRVSISTQNTAINAIKFYLEKVHRGERKVYYVDRPMKESKLPHVLTQDEVRSLIEATRNVKHRCMLLVLYSTGVRMSELLNLRLKDFDESKLQVFVRGGKGRKDRLTVTSRYAIEYIHYYRRQYKPKEYLFEGPGGGRYSPRSVNQVIHRSAELAGVSKRTSAHTLRHSFATHLLEHHLDIRYIQLLMGHESSKTTERYTHMTTKGFSDIKSPLDSLGMNFDTPSTFDE